MEKRTQHRVTAYWSVWLIRTDRSRLRAKTCNVSASGLGLVTDIPLKRDETVLVCLNAYFSGRKHDVSFIGKVAYTTFKGGNEIAVGIQVVGRGEAYQKVVADYISLRPV